MNALMKRPRHRVDLPFEADLAQMPLLFAFQALLQLQDLKKTLDR